jgi:hypothetical protein
MKYDGMEIAYSTEVQAELTKQIKIGNFLLAGLILAFILCISVLLLIYFKTGIIGHYLSLAIC